MAKVDNANAAHAAKLELRNNVLREIDQASVLDCFCGRGAMWRGAWSKALAYAGCDERSIERGDPPRFWCDNLTLLRSIDLNRFNVFDLDAYGSPWAQMVVLATRRKWAPAERGAIVLTDGGSMHSRYGGRCAGLVDLLGEPAHGAPTGVAAALQASKRALQVWLQRSRVRALRRWQAQGNGSGRGAQVMVYTAVVFEGLPN